LGPFRHDEHRLCDAEADQACPRYRLMEGVSVTEALAAELDDMQEPAATLA